MTDAGRQAAAPTGGPPPTKTYTAFVVLHGMGQQRRYESVWRIVEALDSWVYACTANQAGGFAEQRLVVKTRREQLRNETGDCGEGLAYVEAKYENDPSTETVRFYDGYWAPAAVSGTRALSVLVWLLRQTTRPLRVLMAPWRSFARLRRIDLDHALQQARERGRGAGQPVEAFVRGAYAQFIKRRLPERGRFSDFLRFLAHRAESDEAKREAALACARSWRRAHYTALAKSTLLLLLTLLALIAVVLLMVVAAIEVLKALQGYAGLAPFLGRLGIDVEPDLPTALSVLAALAVVSGVTRFLRDAVGDVQQFVTYEETNELHDRRGRILAEAKKTLRHVLADEACHRVVVFGHSLGSAIAVDTILELRAMNECAAPLEPDARHMQGPIQLHKIQHLVTCGSPVDKITFFFATLSSAVRGFERMYEDLRGDIGKVPFSKSGLSPHIHWTNFWDRGDPISGPLDTLMPSEPRIQRVDNVQVANLLWPDIAASHDAYFDDSSLAPYLYDIAFRRQWSFVDPPRTAPAPGHTKGRPLYEWRGPGTGWRLQTIGLLLIPAFLVVLVWTAIGVLAPAVPAPAVTHLGLFAAVLLLGGVIQRAARRFIFSRLIRQAAKLEKLGSAPAPATSPAPHVEP